MRRVGIIVALASIVVGLVGAPAASATPRGPGTLTPIVVRPLSDRRAQPVIGTDGLLHVLYELQIVNTQPVPVPIVRIDVRAVNPRQTVATYEGADLSVRLRHLDGSPVAEPVVEPSTEDLLLVDVQLFAGIAPPRQLTHRVTLGDRAFTAAPVSVTRREATALAAPVQGKNWVVSDGCCSPDSPHRSTILPTAAGFSAASRYAVDLRQMDDLGRFAVDDPSLLTSYPGYGQYVSAVGPGVVVSVTDSFADQAPGTAPPPGTFTPESNDGNTVVIQLRNGQFALYGQLQAGSIIVKPGTYVRRSQPIAQLGNSGNSDAPHLHFELMSAASPIGADGVPFVFSSFAYAGAIDAARLAQLGLAGDYAVDRLPMSQARQRQLPLALSIVDFQSSSGTSGSPLV